VRERVTVPALLLVLTLLLAACGGDDGSVRWRDLTIDVPEGWTVFEEEDTRLSLGNQPLGQDVAEEDRPEGEVVAMFFRHDPGIRPDYWRVHIEGLDESALESDEAIELDGEVPATRMVYSHVTNGLPMREMVVLVPSRGLEILAQPVPSPGDSDAPDVFLEHIDTFIEVLDSARFGAPVD
jgi:hypothetical protein